MKTIRPGKKACYLQNVVGLPVFIGFYPLKSAGWGINNELRQIDAFWFRQALHRTKPLPKHIIKKHWERKYGKNAYYGQE